MLDERQDLGISAVVGQIRSTAVDLLRSIGIDYDSAIATLEEAAGDPPADAPEPAHRPDTGQSV
jgi:hypothetical protein